MSGNQYKARTSAAEGLFGSEQFDREFSAIEERDYLDRGLLEIVPRPYRVLSDNYTIDGKPVPHDEIVELAFPVEIEAALVNGGHLERVRRDARPTVDVDSDEESTAKKASRKKAAAETPQPPKE